MSWINYKMDSKYVENPVLKLSPVGGKGLFLKGDNSSSVLLGGSAKKSIIEQVSEGRYYQSSYPPFHLPREKRFFD